MKPRQPAMSAVYGYIRVSTEHQTQSGLGMAAQRRKIEECARGMRRKVTHVIQDPGVSASQKMFLKRPGGRELDQKAKAGDHIVIAKLDRAFRSLQDFALMLDRWQSRGIVVHLLDVGVDTSTAVGRMVAGIVATVAEWESRRIGERIRDAHAERRAAGRKTNGTTAIGWRAVRKKLVPDFTERKIAREIVCLSNAGKTYIEIAELLTARRVPRRLRKIPRGYRLSGRRHARVPWGDDTVRRWAIAARHRFPITGYHGLKNNLLGKSKSFRQR